MSLRMTVLAAAHVATAYAFHQNFGAGCMSTAHRCRTSALSLCMRVHTTKIIKDVQNLARTGPTSLSALSSWAAGIDLSGATQMTTVTPQNKQLSYDEVELILESDKYRRQMRQRLFHFGLAMFLAATASTGEPALIGGVGTTLALSVALHKFVVVDGMHKDGVSCVALPEHTFYEICDSPGAGLGLFAKMPIEKGQFMMSYDGERIDELEATHRYSHDPNSDTAGYLMRVTDDEYIDASDFAACKFGRVDQPGHLARFMNHATGSPNVSKFVARRPGGFVSFFAARDIAAGEELKFLYSTEYWQAKGAKPI